MKKKEKNNWEFKKTWPGGACSDWKKMLTYHSQMAFRISHDCLESYPILEGAIKEFLRFKATYFCSDVCLFVWTGVGGVDFSNQKILDFLPISEIYFKG